MSKDNVVSLAAPAEVSDPLTDLLRGGARRLIEAAVTAEFEEYLGTFEGQRLADGRRTGDPADAGRAGHGARAARGARGGPPLRPGLAVHVDRVRQPLPRGRRAAVDGRGGGLLRQRAVRELLRHAGVRVDRPVGVRDAARCGACDLRLHRGVLQHQAPPLVHRLSESGGVRAPGRLGPDAGGGVSARIRGPVSRGRAARPFKNGRRASTASLRIGESPRPGARRTQGPLAQMLNCPPKRGRSRRSARAFLQIRVTGRLPMS